MAKWNECQHEQMWFDRPMPLYALNGVATPAGAATTFTIALGLLGCLILLRPEPSRSQGCGGRMRRERSYSNT